MSQHIEYLKKLHACNESIVFAERFNSLQEAWDNCERGDWMLWLLGRISGAPESPERKKLVVVCAEVAELVLPIFEKKYPDDKRVRECIETCKRYVAGNATLEELISARSAADAAASAASYAYAASYAADAAAYAAAADADAYAYAAASAASAADAADARKSMLKQSAELVRKHYPKI
jgi:hypothetical protein